MLMEENDQDEQARQFNEAVHHPRGIVIMSRETWDMLRPKIEEHIPDDLPMWDRAIHIDPVMEFNRMFAFVPPEPPEDWGLFAIQPEPEPVTTTDDEFAMAFSRRPRWGVTRGEA